MCRLCYKKDDIVGLAYEEKWYIGKIEDRSRSVSCVYGKVLDDRGLIYIAKQVLIKSALKTKGGR